MDEATIRERQTGIFFSREDICCLFNQIEEFGQYEVHTAMVQVQTNEGNTDVNRLINRHFCVLRKRISRL